MKRGASGLVVVLVLLAAAVATRAADTLDIYFIDTEGGQATLLVTPAGQSMLIDAGFAGLDSNNPDKETGRDARRIAAAAKLAGVRQIDVLMQRSARLPAETRPLRHGATLRVHHGSGSSFAARFQPVSAPQSPSKRVNFSRCARRSASVMAISNRAREYSACSCNSARSVMFPASCKFCISSSELP